MYVRSWFRPHKLKFHKKMPEGPISKETKVELVTTSVSHTTVNQ